MREFTRDFFLWLPFWAMLAQVQPFKVTEVVGRSMSPTLNPHDPSFSPSSSSSSGFRANDRILVDTRWLGWSWVDALGGSLSSNTHRRWRAGDVVVLRSPERPGELLVKRIVGLQGDWISVPNCNGFQISRQGPAREVQARDVQGGGSRKLKLPPGHCWVEGDAKSSSDDSRAFGVVPISCIEGKATYVVWPPTRWGSIETARERGRILFHADEARS